MGEDGDRLVRFADYGENVSNVNLPKVKSQVNDKRCMEKRERIMDEKKTGGRCEEDPMRLKGRTHRRLKGDRVVQRPLLLW
jgi:hypothetical protein